MKNYKNIIALLLVFVMLIGTLTTSQIFSLDLDVGDDIISIQKTLNLETLKTIKDGDISYNIGSYTLDLRFNNDFSGVISTNTKDMGGGC